MEANYIVNALLKKARAKSTEKVSHGRQCEAFALSFYQREGYRLLKKNLRLKHAECDLVFEKGQKVLLVEVRGKRNGKRRPSRFLSYAKVNRLHYSAKCLVQRYRCSVHTELFEVIGDFPNVKAERFPIYF